MWKIWLIACGIFFIGEMITVGFLIFWLGIGALLAMITSFFTDNVITQTAVFVVSSGLLIFATKPFVKKFGNSKNPINTNAYSIIGKKAIVLENIDPSISCGQIKVSGETWSATCDENLKIEKGMEVEILEINGVKAVVKPINVNIPKDSLRA